MKGIRLNWTSRLWEICANEARINVCILNGRFYRNLLELSFCASSRIYLIFYEDRLVRAGKYC